MHFKIRQVPIITDQKATQALPCHSQAGQAGSGSGCHGWIWRAASGHATLSWLPTSQSERWNQLAHYFLFSFNKRVHQESGCSTIGYESVRVSTATLKSTCGRIILSLAVFALFSAPLVAGPLILNAIRVPRLYLSFRKSNNYTKIVRAVTLNELSDEKMVFGCLTSCQVIKRHPKECQK